MTAWAWPEYAALMPKRQRKHKTGAIYEVKGSGKRTSRLKLVGRLTIAGKKMMIFRPLKQRRRRKTKR